VLHPRGRVAWRVEHDRATELSWRHISIPTDMLIPRMQRGPQEVGRTPRRPNVVQASAQGYGHHQRIARKAPKANEGQRLTSAISPYQSVAMPLRAKNSGNASLARAPCITSVV
jgi:hypothetical protein